MRKLPVSHAIEFVIDRWLTVEGATQGPLQRVLFRRGTRLKARVRPRVIDDPRKGPVEVADLLFEDGTTARNVPFGYFAFAE
jgi:hypothetical protein